MPAAIPLLVAVTAASTIYGAVEQNQQVQHAKGAAEAQATALAGQEKKLTDATVETNANKSRTASSTQNAAMAAIKAAMSSQGGLGGTILTGPGGSAQTPIATKTLLGA